MPATDSANASVRYTFTGQFLEAAAAFVRKAAAMEEGFSGGLTDELRAEHRGFVSTAIMQCAAALETEANELCVYGPGSHLGSGGTDHEAQAFLAPLAEVIDRLQTIERYRVILHLLERRPLQLGLRPCQSVRLVVRLRNEITHYKSQWTEEMSQATLFRSLESLGHQRPPFVQANQNFFPHRCLSAQCGAWAVSSTIEFLEHVYQLLGIPSRFDTHRERFSVPR